MREPEYLRDEHLEYLNTLRTSGSVDMSDALPRLRAVFPALARRQAKGVLRYWRVTVREGGEGKEELGEN